MENGIEPKRTISLTWDDPWKKYEERWKKKPRGEGRPLLYSDISRTERPRRKKPKFKKTESIQTMAGEYGNDVTHRPENRQLAKGMSHFEFNPEQRNFPIYGAAERSYPVKEPIDYRLWIVELIQVYSIGKEMVLNEYVEQKVFRTAYRQWAAAKDEQALISYHEAGFFRELQWKRIKHDKMDEKPIDGWFQFDYVLDLTKGTEDQYIIIG